MQHKSLFAALLCGALCLTACLKNEESPSVTQVRNAKAHELESIAELNKAQATATITLANAQAKLLEAEAKLTEANAKIADAQAKKVEAETALLVVEAKLQEVYVEIAGVELQGKIAELEALKAQYKAEIAAAEAAEAYWNGVKDQVAIELEIEAAQLEAALINAQAEVAEAAAAYAALLHQIEEELAQEEREDLAALRDRIAALSNEYTNASLELIEMKGDLYEANMFKAELEAGLATAEDYKNEVTEKNNNEIARIQKMIDYLMTYQQMTSEEAKDQHVDATIALADATADYLQALTAANAKAEEWVDLMNEYVYTYPTKFYQETTFVEGIGAWGDYSLYDLAYYYYTSAPYDEEREEWVYTYDWVEGEGEEAEEKSEVLYARESMVSKGFVYPELPEGIEDAPLYYESNETRQVFPLMVNRAGFQAIVDNEIAALEAERAEGIEYYDYYIKICQDFIDYWAVPVGQYTELYDAAVALCNETEAAWDETYDTWRAAIQDWYKANAVENMLEIQETLDELTAAIDEYGDIIDGTDVTALETEKSDLEDKIAALTAYKNADYPEQGKWPSYEEDKSWVVWFQAQYDAVMKQVEDKQTELVTANGNVATQQAKVDAAKTNLLAKRDAYYAAERAYYADPTNTTKEDAFHDALAAYNTAVTEYNDAVSDLEGKQAIADGIQEAIDNLLEDADNYAAERDYYQEKVDAPDVLIPEYEARIAEIEQELADYEAAIDAQAEAIVALELYWAELYDLFMESETGEAAWNAYVAFIDAENAYSDALDALDELVALYSNKYENFFEFIELFENGYLYYPSRYDDETELLDFYYDFLDYPDSYLASIYDLTTYDYLGYYIYLFSQQEMSVVALKNASEWAAEQIETINGYKEEWNAEYDEYVATWPTVMDLFDDVTATESVYTNAIETANQTWAEYIELFKVAVDKYIVLTDAIANEKALDMMVELSTGFEEMIAGLEADIVALQDEIADLEQNIQTAEDAIAIMLNPSIALLEEQIEVLEQLVASLKAELNEALAELNQ